MPSIPTTQETKAPNYGPVSMSALTHLSGYFVAWQWTTSGSFLYSTQIMIPPPSGDGIYLICGRRNPYREDGTTPCNNSGWFWAFVQFRTNSSGSTYMWWLMGSSAWSSWQLGRWVNGTFQGFDNTSTGLSWALALQVNGGTDAPFTWQAYMSKLSN